MDEFNERTGSEEQQNNEQQNNEQQNNDFQSADNAEKVTAEQVNQNEYNNSYQYSYSQPPYENNNNFEDSAFHVGKPKKKVNGKVVLIAVLAALVVILSGTLVFTIVKGITNKPKSNETDEITTNQDAPLISTEVGKSGIVSELTGASGSELTSIQVAEKISPSIVGILVYQKDSETLANEGTGFLLKEDANKKYTYIVTCAHVISDSGITIRVQFHDESQIEAEIVGYDTRTDVGIVRVKKTGLKCVTIGSSENLKVGQNVFAVGNPGGTEFFGSFTGGMISAMDRIVGNDFTLECIQHDAAISPGNSGGPLVDTFGNVVGINSSKIYTTDGSYEGMGFAVPMSSYIKDIINKLMVYGYVPGRAKLGISYSPVSYNQTYSMIVQIKELPAGSIIVSGINADSDLAGKDIKKGDLIIAANGKNFENSSDLMALIEKSKVGDEITLTICRIKSNYSTTQFNVKVKLVEDKGSINKEEETTEEETTEMFNPFSPFSYFFPY